jgi:ribosomal protein S18 acetylase RimI-like enzyme
MQDVAPLSELEKQCFSSDLLSKRQFGYWVKAKHRVFLGAFINDVLIGYGLVILRKGTSLARLYSLAVSPEFRGLGVANALLLQLEQACVEHKRAYLRLEVSENNVAGIALYKSMGYSQFGDYAHYYEDNSNALRMQKPVLQNVNALRFAAYPYYVQTTEFTCGPSALLMAMAKLDKNTALSQSAELDLWRIATTIFMTSGHGGTHPLGLAVAAAKRGFVAQVYINQEIPLFLAGVRNESKKAIITQVENDFVIKAEEAKVETLYTDYTAKDIEDALSSGASVLCLISSYQLDGYKGPHWVAVTHIDDDYMYIHDPDASLNEATSEIEPFDEVLYKQHIPVSLASFERFTQFGKAKLRTMIILRPPKKSQ